MSEKREQNAGTHIVGNGNIVVGSFKIGLSNVMEVWVGELLSASLLVNILAF